MRLKLAIDHPLFEGLLPALVERHFGTARRAVTETDAAGCGWATVAAEVRAGGRLATTASLRIALPTAVDDNPWRRSGDQWTP